MKKAIECATSIPRALVVQSHVRPTYRDALEGFDIHTKLLSCLDRCNSRGRGPVWRWVWQCRFASRFRVRFSKDADILLSSRRSLPKLEAAKVGTTGRFQEPPGPDALCRRPCQRNGGQVDLLPLLVWRSEGPLWRHLHVARPSGVISPKAVIQSAIRRTCETFRCPSPAPQASSLRDRPDHPPPRARRASGREHRRQVPSARLHPWTAPPSLGRHRPPSAR
jgi:hypothetical protein